MERPRPTARLFPMSQKRFSQPVRIHLEQFGTVRVIADVHEALDCLMYGWPTERNSQHTRAIETCLSVLTKNALAHEAEAAFSDAADEAGILLREKSRRGVP